MPKQGDLKVWRPKEEDLIGFLLTGIFIHNRDVRENCGPQFREYLKEQELKNAKTG